MRGFGLPSDLFDGNVTEMSVMSEKNERPFPISAAF